MVRKNGDKDYSAREKQLMVSLINDYSLFGATDEEMIKMLSIKIGKKISETLFYRLKKEAIQKRGESGEWLDYYSRYHFVEHYRRRIEELELVQKKILKTFIDETDKQEEKQNKFLINQLAKTIADNSKTLAEFGLAPPIIAKIKSMIPLDINDVSKNKDQNLDYKEKYAIFENDYDDEEEIRIARQNAKSAINIPPLDNEDQYDNREGILTEEYDSNAVF